MANAATGLLGVFVAALCWGSNFVVTKQYDFRDGMAFQFWLCSGILFVGILTLFASRQSASGNYGEYDSVFSMLGLLGGALWAVGNLCSVHIIRAIGLGLGLAIWAGTSLVIGFLLGRLPLFGLEVIPLASLPCGILGCVGSVAALAVFSQVKPTLSDAATDRANPAHAAENDCASPLNHPDIDGGTSASPGTSGGSKLFGCGLAVFAGLVYGLQFFPFTLWAQYNPPAAGTGDLLHSTRFFFSQFCGIWLTSVIALVIHSMMSCGKASAVPVEAMVPSFISGMIWAVAGMGCMIATNDLTYSVGYPLTMNCAFLVNSGWSVFFYKEIKGRRNLTLYSTAALLNIASTVLLTLAKPSS